MKEAQTGGKAQGEAANADEVHSIATALRHLKVEIKPLDDPTWIRPASSKIIDCVISRSRHHRWFVMPRLIRFEQENPGLRTVTALRDHINGAGSPLAYLNREFSYRDERIAQTLSDVARWASDLVEDRDEGGQLTALEAWAASASPRGHEEIEIPGFGIASWQYLRMLFGANTTIPVAHVVGFVERATGAKTNPTVAITLLEKAAGIEEISLRDIGRSAWSKAELFR